MKGEQCTLCSNSADPRHGLLSTEGIYYALCDGCAPWRGEHAIVAARCRESGKPGSLHGRRVGHNELETAK